MLLHSDSKGDRALYAVELWEPGQEVRYVRYTRKGSIAVDKLASATSFAMKSEAMAVAEAITPPTIARVICLTPHPPEGGCSEPGAM